VLFVPAEGQDAAAVVRTAVSRRLAADGGALVAFDVLPDGHAGLTFAAEVVEPGGGRGRYVVKAAPPGVPRSGSTDILRQAPLLAALHASGFPVPRIVQAVDDTELGAAFIVMERLPGHSFIIWRPDEVFLADPAALPALWLQAAEALAVLHRFAWRARLPAWEAPARLSHELDRWAGLLRHTSDAAVLCAARTLHEELTRCVPDDEPIGVVHGDFQPGNLLYAEGRMTGVIDWDLAAIGPQGLDVGWLLMMADPQSWTSEWRPHGSPGPEALLEAYRAAGGPAVANVAWHRAFANFRLVAITGLNLKLHRSGRRVDAVWELFARCAKPALARAADLLRSQEAA